MVPPEGLLHIAGGNGFDGFRLALELAPDIVVTDIKLPGSMNGLELTEALEHDPIH